MRNRDLPKHSEEALKVLEDELPLPDEPEAFLTDVSSFVARSLSHQDCCDLLRHRLQLRTLVTQVVSVGYSRCSDTGASFWESSFSLFASRKSGILNLLSHLLLRLRALIEPINGGVTQTPSTTPQKMKWTITWTYSAIQTGLAHKAGLDSSPSDYPYLPALSQSVRRMVNG